MVGLRWEAIVDSQLFSGENPPTAEIEDVATNLPGFQIGVTGMIDEFCPASTHSSIQSPMPGQLKKCIDLRSTTAPQLFLAGPGLPEIQPLPGVLDHFSSRRNSFDRKDAEAVDSGAAHAEEIFRKAGVDGGKEGAPGSHGGHITGG